jgi:hypothetical protein
MGEGCPELGGKLMRFVMIAALSVLAAVATSRLLVLKTIKVFQARPTPRLPLFRGLL